MMTLLLVMSSLLSILFTQMNHPLAMGLILLIQTTLISMITGLMMQSFWFSYILFLIFLGGMLVLFIYLTSLASNEMFMFSAKLLFLLLLMMPTMFIMLKNNFNLNNQETYTYIIMDNLTKLPLLKLYNYPNSILTIMMVLYLLITLLVVVSITTIFKGPLRQLN
uniref:NADH dehydrogenase subunit 6 n=1 Tax=Salganea incerta TaxID=112978 RepID=UPI0027A9318A|nr:NADH dehydrogenase subunit 6 [Salganea incerta]WGO57662.1 NADH dehydrogenase subunit 6 [Salganea incerta]